MSEKPLIMIVDDEPANCRLLEQALSTDYETITCINGQECLTQSPEYKPSIILLDVMMPDYNGYEVCKKLKDNQETKSIPVIFISALDSLEDRIKGYDAGGYDYLGKPVKFEELFYKIKGLLKTIDENEINEKKAEEAQKACLTALTIGAETARISDFVTDTLSANSVDSLCHLFFNTMRAFNLRSALQLRLNDEVYTINSNWQSLPLEHELMLKSKDERRILEIGQRLFFNYPNCSILVKNPPLDNEEAYGRIKDNIIVLAEAIDARVVYFNTELNLQKQLNINGLFKDTSKIVESIQEQLDIDAKNTVSLTQKMSHNIEDKLLFLGLETDQEEALMQIIDNTTKEIIELTENKDMINSAFKEVLTTMEKAINSMDE